MTKLALDSAKVYRKAAELIAIGQHKYSCVAVDVAAGAYHFCSPEAKAYREMMSEPECGFQFAIYRAALELGPYSHPVYGTDGPWCRDFRILLLCFYAAMVEAGDA